MHPRAPELYESGWTMGQIATQLGTSKQSVQSALRDAQVPVRRSGPGSSESPARVLIDELYADADIVGVLRRHGVARQDGWHRSSAWESYAPLPLAGDLLRALYVDVGLAILHIEMLCGVGTGTVRSGLAAYNIAMRPSRQACPWNQRRHEQRQPRATAGSA